MSNLSLMPTIAEIRICGAKMKASARTKNRAREHRGHNAEWKKTVSDHLSFPGQEVMLLVCDCNWAGWLPFEDLFWEKV